MGFIPKAKQNTAASSPHPSHLGVEHQPAQAQKVIFTSSTKSRFLHTPAKQDILSKIIKKKRKEKKKEREKREKLKENYKKQAL